MLDFLVPKVHLGVIYMWKEFQKVCSLFAFMPFLMTLSNLLSGNNATLSAGDAFGFHMRTINSQNSQRVLVYASAVLQLKLT